MFNFASCRLPAVKRLAPVLLALVAAIFLEVGCGGSAGEPGTTTTSAAKAEFIKRGDSICRNGEKRVEVEIRLNGEYYGVRQKGGPTEAQEEALLEDIFLPAIQKQGEALAKLKPPSGDGEQVDAIVRGIEAGVAESRKSPAKALEEPGPFAEATKLAREYGFKDCGRALSEFGE